jgi:hypothetical protein
MPREFDLSKNWLEIVWHFDENVDKLKDLVMLSEHKLGREGLRLWKLDS